jgi:hypothetical protein
VIPGVGVTHLRYPLIPSRRGWPSTRSPSRRG